MTNKFKSKDLIPWLLATIPIIIHFIVLYKNAINFPFEDDHRVFMDFFYNYLNTNGFVNKFFVLLTPDNESRPFLIRLSLLIPLGIFKTINFKIILYFVNVYTAVLVWVFYKKYKLLPVFLVLLSFLILSHCNWELFFRNDVASYQLATVSLAVLLFYLISKNNPLESSLEKSVFYLSLFVTPFGSALGFIAVFFVLIYTFLRKINVHKFIILIVFVSQLIIYLSSGAGGSGTISILDNVIKYNFELIWVFFIALGGQFVLINNYIWLFTAGILGAIILMISLFLLLKNLKLKTYDFEKLIFLFGAFSLAIIVVSRYNYWIVGYESILGARYKIYGILIFIAGLSFVFNGRINIKIKWAIVSVFIMFYIAWFIKASTFLRQKHETMMIDAYNLENGILRNENVNLPYETKYKYEYLKKNRYFDANEVYNLTTNVLKTGVVVIPTSSELKEVSFDPSFEADWGGKKEKLYKLSLTGEFPVSSSYFIKITDNNQKSILLNGFLKPVSMVRRVFSKQKKVDFLSKEFELSHFKLGKPSKYEVVCIKHL